MQLASFSLAEVTYATGDISYLVQEQAKTASFRVKARQENVSGVILPAFNVDRVAGTGKELRLECLKLAFAYRFFTSHRLQPDRPRTRWPTGPTIQGGLCESGRDVGRTCVAPDRLHDPR